MEEKRFICREGGEGSYYEQLPDYLNEDNRHHGSMIDERIRYLIERNRGATGE